MAFDWIDLPEHLWIKILQQLDFRTFKNTSATCTRFNNLLADTILINKLKLVIDLRSDKQLWNVFKCSKRKYRFIKIFNRGDCKPSFQIVFEILKHSSDCIKELHLDNFKISCYNWNKLIKTLKYVETFCASYITVRRSIFKFKAQTQTSTTKIDLLAISEINYKVDIFKKISVLKLKISSWDFKQHEQFFLNHGELQDLEIQAEMFSDDKLSNVTFSLKQLDMQCAFWTNKQHALNFIRTQTDLKFVYLRLDVHQYDILFLKHIINNNPNLVVLYIQMIGDCDKLFQKDILKFDTNYSVTNFYFCCSTKNPSLFKGVSRLFQNKDIQLLVNYDSLGIEWLELNALESIIL